MLNINQSIEDALKQVFGKILKAGDNEYRVCCPKCEEFVGKKDTKFHLYVNTVIRNIKDPEKVGAWNCFRCDYKGWGLDRLGLKNIPIIKPNIQNTTINLKKPIKDNILTQLTLKVNKIKKNIAQSPQELKLPVYFSTDFGKDLCGRIAYKYLLFRGVTEKQLVEYNIGYCNAGPYSGYIIFPVYSQNKLIYFVARNIYSKVYKNAPVSNKSVLFNYTCQKQIVLCEGILDSLAFGKHGVALLGKTMKDGQFNLLSENPPDRVFICLDSDARKNSVQIAKRLDSIVKDVRIVSLPSKDPNSASKQELLDALVTSKKLTLKSKLEFLLHDKNNRIN
jgi:hypothetical protein